MFTKDERHLCQEKSFQENTNQNSHQNRMETPKIVNCVKLTITTGGDQQNMQWIVHSECG